MQLLHFADGNSDVQTNELSGAKVPDFLSQGTL